eukprot:GHVL01008413.1.p1 GENE.GHVL01008413.1~~GHVL01008413.1.p1  ORF type:complete len:291 (-),score=28.05 GHVL01008413.1:979-1851(-)
MFNCLFTKVKVLDIRSSDEFSKVHLKGSYHIPFESLVNDDRWSELPPGNDSLCIIFDEPVNRELFLRWNTKFIVSNNELWSHASISNQIASGAFEPSSESLLFDASPLLVGKPNESDNLSMLEQIELDISNKSKWVAVDLGCGSGRDSVWLGMSNPKWNIIAVDKWKASIRRAKALAKRFNVIERISFIECDLENCDFKSLIPHSCDLLLMNRFFSRQVLQSSIDSLNGFLAIHTFMEGSHRPTDPKLLIKRGELQNLFSCWKILWNEEKSLKEDGRPVCYFVAKKSGSL